MAAQGDALDLILSSPNILRARARSWFTKYDASRNGLLDYSELHTLLRGVFGELGLPAPTRGGSMTLLKRFDRDSDGALSPDELEELLFYALLNLRDSRPEPAAPAAGRGFLAPRPVAPPPTGTVFGDKKRGSWEEKFDKVRTLGQGSFGTAYLVKPKAGGAERVVKEVQMKPNMPLEMIQQEISNMQAMDHPHVLKLFEYYEMPGMICMVTEPCYGGELQKVIADHAQLGQPLPEKFVAEVMKQSLEAMAYCHTKGLIHKDLKDENIMLLKKVNIAQGERPHCVIIDLGIAEMFKPSNPRGRIMGGTPTTMAPEVFLNSFGPKCDVFSLGCVLFQLLSGELPVNPNDVRWRPLFQNCRTMEEQMAAYLQAKKQGPDWRLLAQASREARDLAMQMMAFKETSRPSCNAALKHSWFQSAPSSVVAIPADKLRGLVKYKEQNDFARAVMVKMAAKMSTSQVTDLAKIFQEYDRDNSGFLDRQEFTQAMAKLGVDAATAGEAMKALDHSGDGLLEYTEFVAGCLMLFDDRKQEALRLAWSEFDPRRVGSVSTAEFERMLSHSKSRELIPAGADVQQIVRDLDRSGTGSVSFEDFVAYFSEPADAANDSESVDGPSLAPGTEVEVWSGSEQAWVLSKVVACKDELVTVEYVGRQAPDGRRLRKQLPLASRHLRPALAPEEQAPAAAAMPDPVKDALNQMSAIAQQLGLPGADEIKRQFARRRHPFAPFVPQMTPLFMPPF